MHLFGGMIGWLLAAAVVLIPTFFVGRYAQTRPPLLTSSRAKSGFGGVLWLFLAGQIGWLLTLVWQTVYMTSELWFMLERNSQTMLAAFVAVVPGLVSICIGAWVIWQIAAKRSPNAVAFAVDGVSDGVCILCCRRVWRSHTERLEASALLKVSKSKSWASTQ